MKSYTHLTQEERYQIHAFMQAGISQDEIASLLKRSPSTFSRELRRNPELAGYRPKQAHRTAHLRARISRTRWRITTSQWSTIRELLRRDWSPQQIAERTRREQTLAISHESIYRCIYADQAAGGRLVRHLRGQKAYRKRYGSGRERRGQLPCRVGIEHRPAAVEKRKQTGHWEADTVRGQGRRGALLSLVERCSRLTRLAKLTRPTAAAVRLGVRRRLAPMVQAVKSITADNGKEFAAHQEIARDLKAKVYFADPYSAYQRGTNENTNGLIRQYLPKSRDLSTLTGAEIRKLENRLNHRPRKCLDFLTPYEVFHHTQCMLTVALSS